MTLDELGIKYGTDKSSLQHDYLKYYEPLFPDRMAVKNILEIGLIRGGNWAHNKTSYPSLNMWREWFPNATIYGFDCKDIKSDDEKIKIFQGDQSRRTDLKILRDALPGEMDMIIDDGSHISYDQQLSFFLLHHKLRKGGCYIIEDLFSKADTEKVFTTLNVLISPGTIWTRYFLQEYKIRIRDSKIHKSNIAFLIKNKGAV